MILFWSFIVFMLLIALGFVLLPVLRKQHGKNKDRTEINMDIYRARLKALEQDHLANKISSEEFQAERDELETNLLHDLPRQADRLARSRRTQDLQITIFLFLVIPFFATLFYHFWGHSDQLTEWFHHQQEERLVHREIKSLGSTQNIIKHFKHLLLEHPNSARGWYLLGRLYSSQANYNEAAEAYATAYHLQPNDIDLMLNYAESLFYKNHERLDKNSTALLRRVLLLEPHNPVAINLLAVDAFLNKKFNLAEHYWQSLLPYVPPGSDDERTLQQAIKEAQDNLKNLYNNSPLLPRYFANSKLPPIPLTPIHQNNNVKPKSS